MWRLYAALAVVTALTVVALVGAVTRGEAQSDPYPVEPDPEFEVPPGGTGSSRPDPSSDGSITTLLYEDGTIYATQTLDEIGQEVVTQFYDEAEEPYLTIEAQYDPSEGYEEPEHYSHIHCGDNVKNPHAWKWNSTMTWYWVQTSTPSYLNLGNTLDSLRDARINWEDNDNWCSISDSSSMNFTYGGTISSSYGNNGINTVGWGSMSGLTGCEGAKACTRTEHPNNVIQESDTRFNSALTWVNGVAAEKYDVETIFSHETGHSIGFGHVGNQSNVMWTPATGVNDGSGNRLGYGDAAGNNSKY